MALIFLSLGWLFGLYLGLSFGAGAVDGSFLQGLVPYLAALAGMAALAALLARDDRTLRYSGLSLAFALLAVWRAFASIPVPEAVPSMAAVTAFHGTVVERPEPRDASLQLIVETNRIMRGEAWAGARTRILVRTDRYDRWLYGDTLTVHGEPRPVSGPGYWPEYLARRGIHATVDYPQIERDEPEDGPNPLRLLDQIRGRLGTLCALLLPEPQASLLAGILVGGRTDMPEGFTDALNVTGTSHLVAVSGFNVTVVAGVALLVATRFLSRRKATLVAITAVWVYAALTGLPPSALRAAIMATMALGSVLAGRDSDALPFLGLSGVVMTALHPSLLYDLGFLLSFLATAGLILLEPGLRGLLSRLPGPLGRAPAWLTSSFTVTMAAQFATMPLISSSFHSLSIVSPLSNLLIAPALPGLMLFGAASVGLGAIFEPLGRALAPLAWVYLTYMVGIVDLTAVLPSASVPTGSLLPLQIAAYYLVLTAIALWPLPEMRDLRDRLASLWSSTPRWVLLGSVAAAMGVAGLALAARPDGKLHLFFLDVGHGDATLIRTAQGHSVLVDGGPSPVNLEGALGRRMGFLDRDLDVVVLTGYGQDRLAGLVEAAGRHHIGLAIEPGRPQGSRASVAWAEVVAKQQIPVVGAEAWQRIDLGGDSYLEVAWVSPKEAKEPVLAVRLVSNGVTALLTGDLPPGAQDELARTPRGRLAVLRVPGQGAASALDDRLVRVAAPEVAVVSVAPNNRYGHPSEAVLQMLKGAAVFRTDHHGTIEVVIDENGGYEVYTER